jgi:peroxin-19
VDALPTFIPDPTKLDPTDEAEEEQLDFARELAKGMENLMRELSAEDSTGSPFKDNDGSPSAESAQALKAVWEQMLVEGMDGDAGVETSTGGGFQDTIKQALNKLKESESSFQVNYNLFSNSFLHLSLEQEQTPNAANAESLEALLSSLGEGGDDKELTGLLENMMGELMSKSVLYEPLSELARGVSLFDWFYFCISTDVKAVPTLS